MGMIVSCGATQAWALEEESHPGLGAESQYAEAVLAFNRKQTDEAIKVLDVILKENPNHVEALELKALSLKVKGDDPKSIGVYEKLISIKPEAERPHEICRT